uniref:Uncharacterized protein n=1 Tax=Anopheles maculatus TaxID=74869 RepID=A0A182SQH8_9DIPT
MKTFVAIAVVALIAGTFALTIDQKKKAEGYAAECVKSSGVPPETAAKLKGGDFAGADDKTKCFAKCFLEKAGFMTDKGEIDEKTVIEKLSVDHDRAKVEGLVKKCNHKEANPCETAFKAYQIINKRQHTEGNPESHLLLKAIRKKDTDTNRPHQSTRMPEHFNIVVVTSAPIRN